MKRTVLLIATTLLIVGCDKNLSTIDGSVSYWCGVAGNFGRSHVDRDYDVCLYVGFESEEAYKFYLDHPGHVALVQKWRNRWRWIRVHDVVNYSQNW